MPFKHPMPLRAHSVEIHVGSDNKQEMIDCLREIIDDLENWDGSSCWIRGGSDCGFRVEYNHDPTMTHDRYFEALCNWDSSVA